MVILLAAAVALTPALRLQRDAEDKARAEVTDLFRALCPEQCVLLSLEARVEQETVGSADPGFDAPRALVAPLLQRATATLPRHAAGTPTAGRGPRRPRARPPARGSARAGRGGAPGAGCADSGRAAVPRDATAAGVRLRAGTGRR